MGMIKRIIGRTSRKLLSKIVPNSQELILNQPAQPGDMTSALHKSSTKRGVARLHRKLKKSSGKNTAVAEALLLAAKNYLPPVQFHHVHGPNAKLSSSRCVARRTQSFCQALVFSSRVILPNERVYIKVLEIAKGWSGTIRFGFTAIDPATLAYRMPKHACPDMTNAGHTWARALADNVVRRNSVIHFSYNKDGFIHYGINNQDCGIFHANVNTEQNLWFIVDIYGLTAAVELIDPRVSSELLEDRSTVYKSTSVMEDIFGERRSASSAGRSRRKQSRKLAARQAAGLIHAGWPLEQRSAILANVHYQQAQLPNLNSVSLPCAQQNIYSPMPADGSTSRTRSQQRNEPHDYHYINNNNPAEVYTSQSVYQPVAGRGQAKLSAATSALNLSSYSSVNNTSSALSTASSSSAYSNAALFEGCRPEICARLDAMNLEDATGSTSHQQSLSRSSKSTTVVSAHQLTPVAAVRRRQPLQQAEQSSSAQTISRRSAPESRSQTKALNQRVGSSTSKQAYLSASASSNSSPSANSAQQMMTGSASNQQTSNACKENVKPKTRHSIKQKSSTSSPSSAANRDNNNPPTKDCPICFERPINCVLYQCGHMCTCYECGVKQWKTQSRTCPICRTVIKDVIKTYMS